MIVVRCGVKRTVSRARGERGANERESEQAGRLAEAIETGNETKPKQIGSVGRARKESESRN